MRFSDAERDNILCLLGEGHRIVFPIKANQHLWLAPQAGEINLGEVRVSPGQAASITNEQALTLIALSDSEFLLIVLW